jgi:CRISPR/Cas system-associated protein Cas7 (RAMP superfamily)
MLIKETRAYALQLSHEVADNEIKEAKDRLDKAVEWLDHFEKVAITHLSKATITHEERLAIGLDSKIVKERVEIAKKELKDSLKKKLELPVE